ncbi:type II secretion system protein [Paenibacillus pinistramenti]|uniref:type II secretion system protein n=1 Tax=Paenibacillus pinistramenti TaxID=1768003 RepID=UPI00110A08E8|nr:prepilin-type N-terminal cleavage/methylation domain-containing protein [Paenibacillus pinistramenti]
MFEKLAQKLREVMGKKENNEKGFTLIELLAVIVIIGIIAVIAIPMISNILDKSKKDADVSTAKQIYDAARIYIVNEANGTTPTENIKLSVLQDGGYLDNDLYLPSNKHELSPDNTVVKFDADGFDGVTLVTTTTGDAEKDYTSKQVLGATAPTASASVAPSGS